MVNPVERGGVGARMAGKVGELGVRCEGGVTRG